MPGYRLIEARMLKPFNTEGIEPHPTRMGFLDFMRELRQDPFPFLPGHKLRIEGLEYLLLEAGDKLEEVESYIHDILANRANELNSVVGCDVQVIFQEKLQRSDDFWVEAGSERHLSLRRIFGAPSRLQGPNGTEFFFAGFNLT
ncbi:MAG: hypothetical protein HY650_03955 [Acidobacteria bacterium]|nr:hypothetical protein [Acidobacteriota bacterium]